jgi:hypothetical protein
MVRLRRALRGFFEKEGGGGRRGEGEPRAGSHLAPWRKAPVHRCGMATEFGEFVHFQHAVPSFISGGVESNQTTRFHSSSSEIDEGVVYIGRKRLVYNARKLVVHNVRKSVVQFGRILTEGRRGIGRPRSGFL